MTVRRNLRPKRSTSSFVYAAKKAYVKTRPALDEDNITTYLIESDAIINGQWDQRQKIYCQRKNGILRRLQKNIFADIAHEFPIEARANAFIVGIETKTIEFVIIKKDDICYLARDADT